METDPVRRDEVEFFAEIRQRCAWIDSRDDPVNGKELGRAAKKRLVVGIEPETSVAQEPTEVEKVTGAAAKIEDMKRRRAVEPEVLDALYVDANPVIRVLIGIDLSRARTVGIILAQSYQFPPVYRAEDAPRTYRMRPTAGVLPETFRCVAGEELLELL